MRLCSQCERQCSWYTQPQPPKLSMHGETCVPVLPHWLPVGRGSAPVRKGRNRGAGREGGGRRRTGKVAEVVERRTAERENGGGWMREVRGVRRETETGGGRWAGGARRVRGGERSRCGRWRRARAARAHFWTSRPRQIGHAPAGCALVHGEVGGVCRSRLLVPCVVDSTRPASSALHSPGRFTPPMREQMPRPETNPPPVQVQCARRPTRVGG